MVETENRSAELEIYHLYIEVASPLLIQCELLAHVFPVSVLNELHDTFTHLARTHLNCADSESREHEISRAKSHMKRYVLDCFKHLCVAYEDYYSRFSSDYKNVDLSDVDNGDFLLQISQRCSHAHRLLKEAKILELSGQDEDILYAAFENAYEAYKAAYNHIESSLGKLERLKLKAKRRDLRTAVINGVSIAVGIVGVLATVVTYFLTR